MNQTVTKENRAFLHAMGTGLIALVLGGALLFGLFAAYAGLQAPGGADFLSGKKIPVGDLKAVMGTTRLSGDTLEVSELAPYQDDARAIVVLRNRFNADNYPFLKYQLPGQHPGLQVRFIWRTAANPRVMSSTEMYWNRGDTTTLNLGKDPNWSGSIIEIGLYFIGELRNGPVLIEELSLEPYNWQTLISNVWSEWTAFQGWRGTSINFLTGTPGIPGTATLSPTLAMAMWSGAALLVLLAIGVIRNGHRAVSYGVAILVPWIALDLLWQSELSTQLDETRHVFAGKSQEEKRLAEADHALFSYVQFLKEGKLPAPGARIFLLHDSDQMTYTRLRAQYFLQPHNVFNYDRFPRKKAAREGDYILALGEIAGLEYEPETKSLKWESDSLPAEVIDKHTMGTLYRVRDSDRK